MTIRARAATALLATLLAVPALLTGCGGDDSPSAGPRSSASGDAGSDSSAPAPSTNASTDTGDDGAEAPPFPANTDPDTADPSTGARSTVTDLRLGRHDGFDRVVLEVDGTGTPGWDARYVDEASSQGSGEAIEVAGDDVLQVTLTGMGYPFDTGVEEYGGPDRLTAGGTEAVTEVVWDSTYEGTSVAFVGTTATSPFRVYLLEDPVRVVVEVADPS